MSLKIDKEHQLTFYNKSISSHFTFQSRVRLPGPTELCNQGSEFCS